MTHAIANGRLRGLMELRDNLLPAYIDQLNKLAGSIVSEFNTQHQQGFDLSGEAGGDFFSPLGEPDQDAANLMAVSISDPKKIAAASSADELPGGNGNAILLAKLQDKQVSSLNATFQGFYANFTGEVGARAALSQRNLSVEEVVSQQLDTMREGISGVSLDEEMTNLISFQRAYQASAKLVVTADELLQTVIGMKQ
jgi:flagellar hook-associated protein 1 FlgK